METKQLKKYNSKQLILKIESNVFDVEDRERALEILKERGVDFDTKGTIIKNMVPEVKSVNQEIIDFIDQAIESDNTVLCQEIGEITGETDYENLSEEQIALLLELRDKKPEKKVKKIKEVESKVRGTKKPKLILTGEQIEQINKLHSEGASIYKIRVQMGLLWSQVSKAIEK